MQISRHTLSPAGYPSILVDALLCFVALLLAASTLTTHYATLPTAVPELPLILVGATIFSLVMALMYAVVGLYRPAPIPMVSAIGRTVFALIVGGYVTALSLRTVADRGYIQQLLPAAIAYLVVGLVVVRGGFYLMRRVAPLPRVLIVGAGPDALALAADLKSTRRNARNVVGLYPASENTEAHAAEASGTRLFSRSQSITDLVSRHGIEEIIVAEREQRGGGVPMDELLACRIRGIPVLDLAGFYERPRCEVPIDSLKASWLVYGHGFVQGGCAPGRQARLRHRQLHAAAGAVPAPSCSLTMLADQAGQPRARSSIGKSASAWAGAASSA